MPTLPIGTVTFLFTDIEGSTRLLQHLGERYTEILEAHHLLLRRAIQERGGCDFDTQGDALFAAFSSAGDALAAAIAAQCALHYHAWPEDGQVRVRMALHTGHPTVVGGGYVGLVLHVTGRISQAGHGGQILISQTTRDLVADALPPGVTLRPLGVHQLKNIADPQHIFQVVVPDLPTDFPPLNLRDTVLNNLPIPLSSFIGREQEIAEVKHLLSTTRLLTLTGSGGCGKTRLALQAATEMLGVYGDGVWLVELAAVSDSDLITQRLALTLHLREQPGRPLLASVTDYLQDKHLLLIVDNCEHLIAGCAHLADALLRACPDLHILATSREALRVSGETTWRVPSLSMPDREHLASLERLARVESVRLFVERASAASRTFALTGENADAIVQVCRRLDGIPLAIELAAARTPVLSVEQIAARLDKAFQLLGAGSRTNLPRHQTLKAAMDWSYDLLSDQERILLRRLSVFAGRFAIEGVEAICVGGGIGADEVLDIFTRLVEKSWVVVEHEGESRYRLLETVRQYSQDSLRESGEAGRIQEQHRNWYLALAERIEPELLGPDESVWLDCLDLEHDNLRAALQWSLANRETEAELRLAGALGWFWFRRGYWSEGRDRLEGALARSQGEPTRARARALYRAGFLTWRIGDYRRAVALSEEGLTLCRNVGDRWGAAFSLQILGSVARYQGDYRRAAALHEEGLSIFRDQGERWGIAFAVSSLGLAAYSQGYYEQAAALYDESLSLFRDLGQKWGTALALHNLGIAKRCQGDYARAVEFHEESLSHFREVGDKLNTSTALDALGRASLYQGDCAHAGVLHNEGLALSRELGDKPGIAYALNSLGTVAVIEGRFPEAAALHEESLGLFRALADSPGIALSLYGLGIAERGRRDYERAVTLLSESLALRAGMGDRLGVAECLEGLAGVACVQHQEERATRLFGAAAVLRHTIGAPLPPVNRSEYQGYLDRAKAKIGTEAFTLAWTEGRAMTPEQAIGYSPTAEAN